MKYLSVCSGIEAATAAWHSLGWTPVAFAEIDKFPSAVLAHHYPHVPNLGDFTKIEASDVGPIDLLVGGTGFTAIPYRGKPAADGPRYKALGNSMAVNCMSWIGTRIAAFEAIKRALNLDDRSEAA